MAVYPNPVVNIVNVEYQIKSVATVKFEIYSMTGAKVIALTACTKPIGEFTEMLSVGTLLPGMYVLNITVDGAPQMHRITVQ